MLCFSPASFSCCQLEGEKHNTKTKTMFHTHKGNSDIGTYRNRQGFTEFLSKLFQQLMSVDMIERKNMFFFSAQGNHGHLIAWNQAKKMKENQIFLSFRKADRMWWGSKQQNRHLRRNLISLKSLKYSFTPHLDNSQKGLISTCDVDQ